MKIYAVSGTLDDLLSLCRTQDLTLCWHCLWP